MQGLWASGPLFVKLKVEQQGQEAVPTGMLARQVAVTLGHKAIPLICTVFLKTSKKEISLLTLFYQHL